MAFCPFMTAASIGDEMRNNVPCAGAECQLWDAGNACCGAMVSVKLDGTLDVLSDKLGDLETAIGGIDEAVGTLEAAITGETGLIAKLEEVKDELADLENNFSGTGGIKESCATLALNSGS